MKHFRALGLHAIHTSARRFDMNFSKKLVAAFIMLMAAFSLVGCGGDTMSVADAKAKADTAKQIGVAEGAAAEAKLVDGKLSAAKVELKTLAVKSARQGGFSSSANCNVLPDSYPATNAAKVFPTNAPTFYKDACALEVAIMNGERATQKQNAVLADRKRQTASTLAAKKVDGQRLALRKSKPNDLKLVAKRP